MKTLLSYIFIIVFLSFTISIYVQAQHSKQLVPELKMGVNISDLYTKDASISDLMFGFNAGISLKVPVSKKFAFQPELYVTTKGASIRYNNSLVNGTALFNLVYLELPLLCEFKVSHRLWLEAGPYVAYLVGAKVKNMDKLEQFEFQQSVSITQLNPIDAGLIIGGGLVVQKITVGIRYTIGFISVGKKNAVTDNHLTIPNANNGVLSFNLTIPLTLNRHISNN